MMYEPNPSSASFCSHKFRSADSRYGIGIIVNGGNILWAHWPFSCGFFTDIRIFRSNLRNKLLPTEKVIAEQVYCD